MSFAIESGLLPAQIAVLEEEIQRILPTGYKRFLSQYNGFYVAAPFYCNVPFDRVDNGDIDLTCFFGYEVSNKNHDLLAINDEFLDEINHVESALLIGADAGDNFYVLTCNEYTPYVYYWDRTHLHAYDDKLNYDIAEQDECGHLYLVATDFATFFNQVIELLYEQKGRPTDDRNT
ncbi:hypothetical protein J2T18_003126 [Paenibacillus polymyxa]|uniref:SMI1/KNR4 family protein n=1 Tax=Paenibacillus polymyxa TaxID=1406 RepID=UPI00278D048D|nr:SMI1/KNR4 family protein [Paenibacillus polymyxa]MDQ0048826.1 hypothetical protein [Paenibacillus polymyxa]